MTEPPPRKRLQIHLSTAVVLMFVAGGLIWANASPQYAAPSIFARGFGWPRIMYAYPSDFYQLREAVNRGGGFSTLTTGAFATDPQAGWQYGGLTIDVVVAVLVLFAVWIVLEWFIRRRASRKKA